VQGFAARRFALAATEPSRAPVRRRRAAGRRA
jgi:hypothetical protein